MAGRQNWNLVAWRRGYRCVGSLRGARRSSCPEGEECRGRTHQTEPLRTNTNCEWGPNDIWDRHSDMLMYRAGNLLGLTVAHDTSTSVLHYLRSGAPQELMGVGDAVPPRHFFGEWREVYMSTQYRVEATIKAGPAEPCRHRGI